MPNAASSGLPNPQSYDTSLAGVVRDRVTGLVWQRDVDPYAYPFGAAAQYCRGLALAGRNDWRLPSVLELVSIVDATRAEPAIDGDVFPNTPPLPFWSSQTETDNLGLGWYVYFKNGGAYGGNDVSDPQRVRCVRGTATDDGGASCYAIIGGVVHDTRTGLTWQQAADLAPYTWSDALGHCSALSSSPHGAGFRLPSVNELLTLVDLTRADPAADVSAFPDTSSDFFWSSSPGAGQPGSAWGVSFNRGSAGVNLIGNSGRARCVR